MLNYITCCVNHVSLLIAICLTSLTGFIAQTGERPLVDLVQHLLLVEAVEVLRVRPRHRRLVRLLGVRVVVRERVEAVLTVSVGGYAHGVSSHLLLLGGEQMLVL